MRPFHNSLCGPLCRQDSPQKPHVCRNTLRFFVQFPGQAPGQAFPNTDLTERVMKRSHSRSQLNSSGF